MFWLESWIFCFLSCTDISLCSPPLQTELFIHSPLTSSSSFCYFSNSCWSNCVPLLPLAPTVALRRSPLALFSPCSSSPTSQYADWASESSPSKRVIKNDRIRQDRWWLRSWQGTFLNCSMTVSKWKRLNVFLTCVPWFCIINLCQPKRKQNIILFTHFHHILEGMQR